MDFISYRGKRVVITGCASGMGRATAGQLLGLGAEVHGLDFQDCDLPLASFTRMDLRDAVAIEAAAAGLAGDFDALFNCAGVAGRFAALDIFTINYIGPRHLTRLLLPRIASGGAIACIASSAGMGWTRRLPQLLELVSQDLAWDEARRWAETALADGRDAYSFSKEAIIVWTLQASQALIRRGIRMNCILPGPTQTAFMTAQVEVTPGAVIDAFTQPIGRYSTPEEQAAALVFLNSSVASYVNGVALAVDGGFTAGVATGAIDLARMFAKR